MISCAICPSRDGEGYVLYDEDGQPLYGVDCGDWDDFVKHKIENPHHRSCPVCGQVSLFGLSSLVAANQCSGLQVKGRPPSPCQEPSSETTNDHMSRL